MGRECSRQERNETKFWRNKLEGKGQLVRIRHICEDNIKTDLNKIGCEDVDWIHLA
jgi:hypothetical protein